MNKHQQNDSVKKRDRNKFKRKQMSPKKFDNCGVNDDQNVGERKNNSFNIFNRKKANTSFKSSFVAVEDEKDDTFLGNSSNDLKQSKKKNKNKFKKGKSLQEKSSFTTADDNLGGNMDNTFPENSIKQSNSSNKKNKNKFKKEIISPFKGKKANAPDDEKNVGGKKGKGFNIFSHKTVSAVEILNKSNSPTNVGNEDDSFLGNSSNDLKQSKKKNKKFKIGGQSLQEKSSLTTADDNLGGKLQNSSSKEMKSSEAITSSGKNLAGRITKMFKQKRKAGNIFSENIEAAGTVSDEEMNVDSPALKDGSSCVIYNRGKNRSPHQGKSDNKTNISLARSKSKIAARFSGQIEDELDLSMESKNLSMKSRKISPKKNKRQVEVDQGLCDSSTASLDHPSANASKKHLLKNGKTLHDSTKEFDARPKISALMKKNKRKWLQDSSNPEEIPNLPPTKKNKFSHSILKSKFSKQAKKLQRELPGLEEPELTKYQAFSSSYNEDDESSLESDENFHISSDDDSSDERDESNGISNRNKEHKGDKFIKQLSHDSSEKLSRTVFVGNLPLGMDQKTFKQTFASVGKVEAVRFRSSIPKRIGIPKKVANIMHEYHEGVTSLKGFVVFKDVESVEKALAMNGTLVKGHHIRVDRLFHQNRINNDLSVFVGNLPFNVDDESLWNLFTQFGEVKSVRVIRDRISGLGKGFGFVQFEDAASAQAAVDFEDLEIGGRKLRVKKSDFAPKQENASKNKLDKNQSNHWQPIGQELSDDMKSAMKKKAKSMKRKAGFKKFRRRGDNSRESRKTHKKMFQKRKRDQEKKKISSLFAK